MTLDIILRFLTIALFILWQLYWMLTEIISEREKPKKEISSMSKYLLRYEIILLGIFLTIQLLGYRLLPMSPSILIQVLGFIVVLIGISVAVSARITLGSNWSHAAEYQIKPKQELITNGIYKYIRHPIYSGLAIAYAGGMLVAETYLFIFFFFLILFAAYTQGKKEEKLLTTHFGDEYRHYMKKSKMLIPYII